MPDVVEFNLPPTLKPDVRERDIKIMELIAAAGRNGTTIPEMAPALRMDISALRARLMTMRDHGSIQSGRSKSRATKGRTGAQEPLLWRLVLRS